MSQSTRASDRLRRWGLLLLGLTGLWAFVFLLAPWIEGWEPVGEVCAAVRESGIDATALFYTEVEEVAEAERTLRNSIGQ